MTFSNNEPKDAGGIPISSVYGTGNTFPALAGMPGANVDASSNAATAVMTGYIRPAVVQKANAVTGTAGKTLTIAFSSNVTAGNSIIVSLGCGEVPNGTTITIAVTDSLANTYKQAVLASQSTTQAAVIFYASNIAAGANTVTVTIAGGSSTNTAIAAEIYEVYGLIDVAGSLDLTSTGNNAGSTSVTTGALTPSIPNELAITAIAAAGGTITAGTNWTLDSGTLAPTGGNLVSFGSESQLLTDIASITPAATLSGSNAWAAATVLLQSVAVPIIGMVTANQGGTWAVQQSGTWTVQPGNTANTTAWKVDGSGVTQPVSGAFWQATQPVSGTVTANQGGTWTIQPGNTANTTAWKVDGSSVTQPVSGTVTTNTAVTSTGGSVPYHNITAATTNFTNVKTSACQMYRYSISNTSTATIYVKFYDKASTPTTTDVPKHTMMVPSGSPVLHAMPEGMKFVNGFGWAATGGVADNDNTAIAASCVVDFSLNV